MSGKIKEGRRLPRRPAARDGPLVARRRPWSLTPRDIPLIALAIRLQYCILMAGRLKARDEFVSGLTMTIAFGALWIFLGSNFWIFPMVFAGVIPLVRGGLRFFSDRGLPDQRRKQLLEAQTVNIERAILSVAKRENGRITPALVALSTDAGLEEAQKALEEMVKHGYAGMDVRDNGTVEYVFEEFLP